MHERTKHGGRCAATHRALRAEVRLSERGVGTWDRAERAGERLFERWGIGATSALQTLSIPVVLSGEVVA